jgi:hypothetical protein
MPGAFAATHTSGGDSEFHSAGKELVMPRTSTRILSVAVLGLALAGCGYRPGERAVSGGLIGAGAGAVLGTVTGGDPVTGAVIGGAVGAVGGAVTSPRRINLGRPAWRQGD